MVPQPRRHNPQRQPITTALRNICRDYPAGGGILRELLQNADDAGASTMEFVLDTQFHPTSPLLDPALADFQGPALLAHNSATFSDTDFASLSSLGDSSKINDISATGKFGRGFSSVFNWTDSPSILSNSTLLVLDPHHSWSSKFPVPGGPMYDFPEDAEDEAMKNQLAAYSHILSHPDQPFEGTIIRVPIRDSRWAQRSAIRQEETKLEDVKSAMISLAEEIKSGAFIFLRNILKISLRIDNVFLASMEVTNGEDVLRQRALVNEALRRLSDSSAEDRARQDIPLTIDLKNQHKDMPVTTNTFLLHHLIDPSVFDQELGKWAASQKLLPWVALAAPLQLSSHDEKVEGDLFSVLPLHIPTKQPLYIHGLFSISPDRARLHGSHDETVQDRRPQQWNRMLFDQLIPEAWAQLLNTHRRHKPEQNAFHLWPQEPKHPRELWDAMCKHVANAACQQDLAVWYTDVGYKSVSDGLFLASPTHSSDERRAFREARAPIIYLEDPIFRYAQRLPGVEELSSRTICKHLHKFSQLHAIANESKLILLEYILHSPPRPLLADWTSLALFPFENGEFYSLKRDHDIFLHRDALEKELFSLTPQENLDTNRISSKTVEFFRKVLRKSPGTTISSLRFRTLEAYSKYCLRNVFVEADTSSNAIEIEGDAGLRVLKSWEWIEKRCKETEGGSIANTLSGTGSLWLIPLVNGKFRKLMPSNATHTATYILKPEMRALIMEVANIDMARAPSIVDIESLPEDSASFFMQLAREIPGLCLRGGRDLEAFVQWLADDRTPLAAATDETKRSIVDMIAREALHQDSISAESLRKLCIFQGLSWNFREPDTSIERSWTNLMGSENFVGLRDFTIPVPSSTKTTCLDLTNNYVRSLVERLGVANLTTRKQLIDDIVIPSFERGGYEGLHPRARLDLSHNIMRDFSILSPSTQQSIAKLNVVPLEMVLLDKPRTYGAASSLIAPHATKVTSLFFEDEPICPESNFFESYRVVLRLCGMRIDLDRSILLDRIKRYADKQKPTEQVSIRATNMLRMDIPEAFWDDEELRKVARTRYWLPITGAERAITLVSSVDCRDLKDQHLVSYVMPSLPFKVGKGWRSILGWDMPISTATIHAQLQHSINEEKLKIVDRILTYISQTGLRKEYLEPLKHMSFVYTGASRFVAPDKVCRKDCANLSPFLYNVDPNFLAKHDNLLTKFDIRERPTLKDLEQCQKSLPSTGALNKEQLAVAIEVLRLASHLPAETFRGFKVPDEKNALIDIDDVVFNDLGPGMQDETLLVTNSQISRDIADRLRIEPLSSKIERGALEINDQDEEEFDQREEVTDGIRDTLERYPIQSTFHEYLANADDCGKATQVSFMLDETNHSTKSLLTPELAALQGPALFIHNDGVFRDKDFEGMKYVGRGSKRDDPTTIGKFGRGSQTMYHWTDVPMILSGDYFLVLDPQQNCLPINFRTRRRRAGLKVKISKLRIRNPDQLAPFAGLWGYSCSDDYYDGTIFRFPLREKGSSSALLENDGNHPTSLNAYQIFEDLFEYARISLLYLRNINSVDFQVRHNPKKTWVVEALSPVNDIEDDRNFSGWAKFSVTRTFSDGRNQCATDKWWRAIEDTLEIPVELQGRSKRAIKYTECGIAALIASDGSISTAPKFEVPTTRFFNCLPLMRFQSHLLVNVHATFLLSGDRQSIAIEEGMKDTGSDWNRWLLENAIPELYYAFLEDLGRHVGERVYDFFPTNSTRGDALSSLVQDSFWERLPRSDSRIFPVVQKLANDTVKPGEKRGSKRSAPKLVEFGKATFDILKRTDHQIIRPLLPHWLMDLVRPPQRLRRFLKKLPDISLVNPHLVRRALRSRAASNHSEEAIIDDYEVLSALLSFIKPQGEAEFEELDGCKILPLADGTLGTLALKSKARPGHITYISADKSDGEIFHFALSLLSSDEINTDFISSIINSKRFNLERLDLSHISRLLLCQKSWPTASNDSRSDWLRRFWKLVNRLDLIEAEEIGRAFDSSISGISHYPLLKGRMGKSIRFLSLDEMKTLPATVEPLLEQHRELLKHVPGLYLLNRNTMPSALSIEERSLQTMASVSRFLNALSILASEADLSVSRFVHTHMPGKHIKILQKIILDLYEPHQEPLSAQFQSDVKKLPIWPSASKLSSYLTAQEALATTRKEYLTPWCRELGRFVDPTFCIKRKTLLQEIGVHVLLDDDMLTKYTLPDMPSYIGHHEEDPYERLVRVLSRGIIESPLVKLSTRLFAAGRDGEMRLPRAYYDNSNELFAAAFRCEASAKFVMESVASLSLWNSLGRRSHPYREISGKHYLDCLMALSQRFKRVLDPHLASDEDKVLSPLCTNEYRLNASRQEWDSMAAVPAFRVTSQLQGQRPEYRQRQMDQLATNQKALELRNVVLREHLPICWSQTAFPSHEPLKATLASARLDGRPHPTIVWKHLAHLASLSGSILEEDLGQYISDLRSTYEYLQERLDESTKSFCHPQAALWLNTDASAPEQITLNELEHTWTKLEHLIAGGACDAPPLMAIRTFLLPYERLLKAIGCVSMTYPPLDLPSLKDSSTVSSGLHKLWRDKKLIDITFSADGHEVTAHKAVLAARSSYCETLCNGSWQTTENGGPINITYMDHKTLEFLVESAYLDKVDWTPMQVHNTDELEVVAQKLDDLLAIMHGASYLVMPAMLADVQQQILHGRRLFIRVDNVEAIEKIATTANAKELRAYCESFRGRNQRAVHLASLG